MRLLVTRPPDEAARTARKLLALGHEPVLTPVFEIVSTGAAPSVVSAELVIATSARAFDGVKGAGAAACVGDRTAEAARAAGFAVRVAAPDATALADLLLKEPAPRGVLYLAGRERRPTLESRLSAAGWRIELVETYFTRPVSAWPEEVMSALDAGQIDGVLHYSPRSAELALGLVGNGAARLAHYCLSPAIARICAGAAKPERIFVASQANEDSLLSLLGRPPA